MGWDSAASWLMGHSAPASFLEPAAYTPEDRQNCPQSVEDPDYELYLDDWIHRVETGDLTGAAA